MCPEEYRGIELVNYYQERIEKGARETMEDVTAGKSELRSDQNADVFRNPEACLYLPETVPSSHRRARGPR